jgi:phosphoglycolate phosphatase
MPSTLILDLDGTLVDSAPDLTAALNRLARARGLAPFDRQEVAAMVGDGARMLLARALAARNAAFDEAALDAFLADYTANAAVETRPFPGVSETLPGLAAAGWRLAVCTNKPAAAARSLLAALGLAPFFAAVGGGDSFPTRKPDPGHLLATLSAAGGAIDAAIMVGDHANDVQAATDAGLPCIFAAWGYGPPEMAAGAAGVARRFTDVPALAETLLRAQR